VTDQAWRAAYRGRRVLVLGASGFIGRWVTLELSRVGAELTVLVRDPADAGQVLRAMGADPAVCRGELTDHASTRRTVTQIAPAIVFNLAGYGVDPDERQESKESLALALNAELPAVLAESLVPVPAGDWTGRRLVHVGSVFEYGQIGGHLEEDAPPAPTGLYGTSKLAGTRRLGLSCDRTGLAALTARIAQIYGPGEHYGRLLPDLLKARGGTGSVSLTVGTQQKDFTHVGDVAEGLLRLGASQGPPGEVVNLATGRLTTVRDFVLTAAHLLRLDRTRLKFEKPLPDNELEHEEIAIDRLRRLTGWTPPTTVREGILRTLAFLDRSDHPREPE